MARVSSAIVSITLRVMSALKWSVRSTFRVGVQPSGCVVQSRLKPVLQRPELQRRRGITLIMMLCVMTVIAVVSAGILALMTSDRQVLHREATRVQAEWLATAGLEHGAAKLLAAAEYRGETWLLTVADLDGQDGGSVTIRVEPQVGRPGQFTISADAEAGRVAGKHVRAARTITIDRQAAVRNSGEKP